MSVVEGQDVGSRDVLSRYRDSKGQDEESVGRKVATQVLSEVIYTRRQDSTQPISSTEYFAACMSVIDTPEKQLGKEKVHFLFLLCAVIPQVSPAVLQRKGEDCLTPVMEILKSSQKLKDRNLSTKYTRYCVSCVALLLKGLTHNQETWSRPPVLTAFNSLLSCQAHERPKVRKSSQQAVLEILTLCSGVSAPHKMVAQVCVTVLEECSVTDCVSTMQLLSFLKQGLKVLRSGVNKIVLKVIALSQIGHVDLSLYAFITLASFIESSEKLDEKLLRKTINSLCSLAQSNVSLLANNESVCKQWSACLEASAKHLMVLKVDDFSQVISKVMQSLVAVMCASAKPTSAAATSKSLIANCVATEYDGAKVYEVLEKLTLPQHQSIWKYTFVTFEQLFRSMKDKKDATFLVPLLCKLIVFRESVVNPITGADKDMTIPWKTTVECVITAAVNTYGLEAFLTYIPLKGTGSNGVKKGITPTRAWLLPLLRDAMTSTKTTLKYFRVGVLKVAAECEARSEELENKAAAKMEITRAIQLWALFPSICQLADDASDQEGFPALAPVLAQVLQDKRYPELTLIVSNGMQTLIERALTTEEQQVYAGFARNFLPLLFNCYTEQFTNGKTALAQTLHDLTRSYASIASKEVVNNLFKQLLKQMLTEGEEQRVLFSLSLALIPSLGESSVDYLFRVVRPSIEEPEDNLLQKTSYKVLECICQNQPNWVLAKREELTLLLRTSLLATSANAKTSRLHCLFDIVRAMKKTAGGPQNENNTGSERTEVLDVEKVTAFASDLLGEVILCTKESNNKARMVAFKLLVELCDCMESVYVAQGQPASEGIKKFLYILLAGLAAQTPHMRSAVVVSLSRVLTHYHTLSGNSGVADAEGEEIVEANVRVAKEIESVVIDVAKTTLLLLKEKSREVAKSGIGFAKVCAVRLPKEVTLLLLDDIVTALLPWADDTKNRFSLKIRLIFERLVKRLGVEALENCETLPKDNKIMAYIKKQAAYKKRRYEKKTETVTSNLSESRKRKHGVDTAVTMDETEGQLDLLDPSALGKVNVSKATKKYDSDSEDSVIEFTKDGRLVILEDDIEDEQKDDFEMDESDEDSEDYDMVVPQKKKQKGLVSVETNSKTGGDKKKKGSKLEPYAYIKLNPKLLNKRRKHEASKQFAGIGKSKRSKQERNAQRKKAGNRGKRQR